MTAHGLIIYLLCCIVITAFNVIIIEKLPSGIDLYLIIALICLWVIVSAHVIRYFWTWWKNKKT